MAAVEATAALCESLGHTVEEATLPVDGDAFVAHFVNQWACSNAWAIADWEARVGRTAARGGPRALELGPGRARPLPSTAGPYLKVGAGAAADQPRQIADYFEGIDVLLTPTLAEPPAPLGTFDSPPGEPLTGLFRAARPTSRSPRRST